MIRLKDIAAQTGVSIMTVSKALRDAPDVSAATKVRIKQAAQQLGYVPDSTAQGLRTRTTRLLGAAVPSCADPIFARIVVGIEQGVGEMGYDLILAQTLNIPEREEGCIRKFLSRRVDGMFIAPAYRMSNEARIYSEVAESGVPVVLLGGAAPFCAQFTAVECDDLVASHTITDHLLKLGHRRIAFLAGPAPAVWAQQRFEGYRRALRAAGIEPDEKMVFQAGRSLEDGVKAATQMLDERCGATAVQAVTDHVAIGCSGVLLAQGLRIPEDVSVAGFGNVALTDRLRIPLTTVDQPKQRLGVAAAQVMRQLLQKKPVTTRPLPAELIVRSSSGIAPALSRL